MENETRNEPKSSMNGLIAVLGLTALIGGGLGIMSLASQANALSTNQSAEALSDRASKKSPSEFLQSVGYNGQVSPGNQIYFRPVVDGFWKSEVQIVVAPKMKPDGMIFRNKNLLFDAYSGTNKVGKVIASFTPKELAKRGYSQ